MQKRFMCLIVACLMVCSVVGTVGAGELNASASVAVQIQKNTNAAGNTPLNAAFTRAETQLSGKSDEGVNGLLHLRFQRSANSAPALLQEALVRQAYFNTEVANGVVQAGRWYDVYTPGLYFGRYLWGAGALGNGAFLQNYTIIDGVQYKTCILEGSKTDLIVAFLPLNATADNDYLLARLVSNPVEALKVSASLNVQTQAPVGSSTTNLMAITAAYDVMSSLNVFGEFGICNLDKSSDNTWISLGAVLPKPEFLNELRVEAEYKKDKLGAGASNDVDLAWILQVQKKVSGLIMDLGISSDPQNLGSSKISEIGAYMRTTAKFK